jgi:APA family basic amino acid/polyamine antiporter
MRRSILRTKPVERILTEAREYQGGLKRVLTAVDLTAIGVGAIIGAGIFVLTGTAARDAAGPAIMLSYVFAGVACILAALCYAEFASRLPISGSAYTYAYATVGELFAWIIGWDLILEYTIGSATVAVGWTHYLEEFLKGFGVTLPTFMLAGHLGPFTVNWAAMLLVALLTVLLCIGIKESARFNALMVLIKLGVVVFVILAGMLWVKPANWHPFFPYGVQGIFSGAALIFFSYIGFDAVSTAAEEVKNPQRDLPIGLIASLSICTLLYVAVSAVITGMVPYGQIDPGAPLAAAFGSVGNTLAQKLIALGGFVGLTTVVLILMMSQPRIWFAMARDGLLWPWFSKVHPRFRTPFNATILTGIIAGLMAGFASLEALHHTVSIGTLFAFAVVSGSMLIMRYKDETQPEKSVLTVIQLAAGMGLFCFGLVHSFSCSAFGMLLSPVSFFGLFSLQVAQLILILVGLAISAAPLYRLFTWRAVNIPSTFRCPFVPLVPVLAMFGNIGMMMFLNGDAWLRLGIWFVLGMLLYGFYGRHHSRLNQ